MLNWLSLIGTGLDVTKLLMRHSTIAMSMNTYGDAIGDEANDASSKIAERGFRETKRKTDRNPPKPLKSWWAL
jgi:hypothetical protein